MAEQGNRPHAAFGRWLKRMRQSAGLTQQESVAIMSERSRNGRSVSVGTWSRWENGIRLPPRTKIDLVSAVIHIPPDRVRRRAGYHASLRTVRRDRHSIVASILREFSRDSSPEIRLLHIYALAMAYYEVPNANVFINPIADVTKILDEVYSVEPVLRHALVQHIKRVCEDAKKTRFLTAPAKKAVIKFSKQRRLPITLGAEVRVESVDSKGKTFWNSYYVRNIEEQDDAVIALIMRRT